MLNDVRFECLAELRAFGLHGAKKVQAADRNGFNGFSSDEEEAAVLANLLQEHTGYRTYAAWVEAERSNKRESILERKEAR
ncbi:hypothetical protein BWQ96_10162 [Gracilariopsis chorda]|uniref:Uncharacterized protein n=1 Tax=Gracilariopsis chorda TaxID=448386 RepID=A0A2V3IDH5_9FLOR|nr:hypothetical protein BWQ96_10162 [Gracilariopsis chorda]|eukprot:PXF40124.1 hypothetical protein BWQ96_10162 [Gracilariopsis chorda]